MSDNETIKYILLSFAAGWAITAMYYKAKFRHAMKIYVDFMHYKRQGFSVERSWELAQATIE